MNANELADELEIVKNKIIGKEHEFGARAIIFYTEAATMLRQQQAEIEALNQRIERMIENQSHHEGIAHAGGFESGYQAAKANTLTDEEISEVMYQCDWQYDPESFAKAILRKAQEK